MSTSEKLGCDRLDELELPPLAEGEEDEDGRLDEDEDGELVEDEEDGLLVDEPVELLPLEDGEVADGVLDEDDGLLDDDEDCATASDDSANITAAAVTPRVLGMRRSPVG